MRIIQSTCSSNVSYFAYSAPSALQPLAGLSRNSLGDMDTDVGENWVVARSGRRWADGTSWVIGFSLTKCDMVPYGAGGHYSCGGRGPVQSSLYCLYR